VVSAPIAAATRGVDRLRRHRNGLDRTLDALARYHRCHADRMAAMIAYYGFMSLVPLVLLASSVLGFVLAGSPARQDALLAHVSDFLPGTFATSLIDGVESSRVSAGVLGVFGLLYAGLAWIDAMRVGLRVVWELPEYQINPVLRRLVDVVLLIGLGVAFFATISISVAGTAASGALFDALDLRGFAARWTVRLAAVLVALAANVLLFTFVFGRLARHRLAGRRVLAGALLAGVLFEALKLGGAYYLTYATRYASGLGGSAAGVLGALVWLNLAARLTLFSATWAATGLPAPAGTSPVADPAVEGGPPPAGAEFWSDADGTGWAMGAGMAQVEGDGGSGDGGPGAPQRDEAAGGEPGDGPRGHQVDHAVDGDVAVAGDQQGAARRHQVGADDDGARAQAGAVGHVVGLDPGRHRSPDHGRHEHG
jgi:membrane protein